MVCSCRYRYHHHLQRFETYSSLTITLLTLLPTGYDTFIPFTKDTFVTSYIAIPTFVLFWGSYKIFYKTKQIAPERVDLITGKREIDEEEERFNREEELKGPRTKWQKFWDNL